MLWEHSSAGRASALQAEGHRFEPYCSHQKSTSSEVLFSLSRNMKKKKGEIAMIYRFIFKGYPKKPKNQKNKDMKLKENNNAKNVSIFEFENMVFMYAESKKENINPTDIVEAELIPYPDGSEWENMSEVFHYSMPQSDESWERTQKKTPKLRVNYVRHGKISSYIYYHFQYQEEYPCDGDKYGIIFHSGDLLVFYTESPTEFAPKYKGLLDTKNSPLHDEWAKLMENEHFDTKFGGWKLVERIL